MMRRALVLIFGLLLAACPALAQEPLVFAYANITTDTTTTLKSVPGFPPFHLREHARRHRHGYGL
jgi:hypothetical protein